MEEYKTDIQKQKKLSAPLWNDKRELPDGSYSLSDLPDYFKYIIQKHKMMKIMMNCFCGLDDQQKVLSLISSWHHCQGFSSSQISKTQPVGFEPEQNQSSDVLE